MLNAFQGRSSTYVESTLRCDTRKADCIEGAEGFNNDRCNRTVMAARPILAKARWSKREQNSWRLFMGGATMQLPDPVHSDGEWPLFSLVRQAFLVLST